MSNMKNTGNMELLDYIGELDEACTNLQLIPSTISALIDAYNLDSTELTKEQEFDIIMHHNIICDVLTLAHKTILDYIDAKDRITLKHTKSPESTNTPAETTK